MHDSDKYHFYTYGQKLNPENDHFFNAFILKTLMLSLSLSLSQIYFNKPIQMNICKNIKIFKYSKQSSIFCCFVQIYMILFFFYRQFIIWDNLNLILCFLYDVQRLLIEFFKLS